ncbi:WD40 repeat domain-containing protein [Marinactinospora rubrisoli]|uniref:WD40 repeat domain-containing protein n=1 Tax=Marinactinospora rubrisoli TaxID=2715399 RepID=A0ABW2KCI1_9ACTN
MSTDLYGARVLGVDLDRREVRLRVFVVYYETATRHYTAPPERDPGFFLGLLWESGRWAHPIGKAVSVEQMLGEGWVVENARWFVEEVERTAVRNDPPREDAWDRMHDFYYEREGRWRDEELLVQADYVVRVTDPAWIEHLSPGDAWGSAWYPMDADDPSGADLPHVPDVHAPLELRPFGDEGPHGVAFSDDGRFLAVDGDDEDVVVYDCADWSEHARFDLPDSDLTWNLKWVPGQHVVARTDFDSLETVQRAYDVVARAAVEVPLEQGFARSRTGRHRIEFGQVDGVEFLVDGQRVPVPGVEEVAVETAAFTTDESRLFAAGMARDVHVIDPESRVVVDRISDVAGRVSGLAVSPCGGYLITAGSPADAPMEDDVVLVHRLGDRKVVLRHRPGADVAGLAWSPDGRWVAMNLEHTSGGGELRVMPVGLPAEPPAELRAPAR